MEGFTLVAPGVYQLRVPFGASWTGVTLVRGAQNALVDSAACAETVDSHILPALAALGMTLGDVEFLFCTHTHGDHVGGHARLRALAPHLRVVCGARSAEKLRDPLKYSKRIRAAFPADSPAAPAVLDGAEPDAVLEDGESLGGLRLLDTPGHDTDAVSYLDLRTNTLLTGDSLQLDGTAGQGCALVMDLAGYRASLSRLMAMDIDSIVAGHDYLPLGGAAIGREASRAYLVACLARMDFYGGFVAGAMRAGETDPRAIARALITELGGKVPPYLFLPLYTITQCMTERERNA